MAYILAVVLAVLFLGADQLTKYIVISNMELFESVPFIKGLMNFTYIHNTGGAWGILNRHTWVLIVFTAIALLVCLFVLIKYARNKILIFALCLILSGGIGNMIDRIFRSGKVIDFLEFTFIDFPVFNVADIAVCIGAGLLMLYFVLDTIKEQKEKKANG